MLRKRLYLFRLPEQTVLSLETLSIHSGGGLLFGFLIFTERIIKIKREVSPE